MALSKRGGSSGVSARSGGGSPTANQNATSLARGAPNDEAAAALVSPLQGRSRSHIAEYLRVRHCPDGRVQRRYGAPPIHRSAMSLAHYGASNRTEPLQPLAPSKQSTVQTLKSVSVTRRSGALRCGEQLCQYRLTHPVCQSILTCMDIEELSVNLSSDDPAIGLRASLALHRLAERVEAKNVAAARYKGWSWEQIGDALGVTRQSVHTKYNKESS